MLRRNMMRNRKFKLLIFISSISIIAILILNFIITTEHLHVLHLYLYKVNEFLLPYYHKPVIDLPDDIDSNKVKIFEDTNYLCMIPEIRHDNKLAMKYLNNDFIMLNKTFYQCDDVEKEIDLVYSKDYTLFDLETKKINERLVQVLKKQEIINETPEEYKYVEYYSLQLDIKGFYKKLNQNENDIDCYAQSFDKKLNESENKEAILMSAIERKFEKNFNFTLYFDAYGFYYVNCYKNSLIRKFKVYEHVYNVFPRDMLILKENRRQFIKFENEKRQQLNQEPEIITFNDTEVKYDLNKQSNVLILGYDSLSRNHFKRVFPLTYNVLKSKLENTVIYEALSSVGHNTFPTIMAFMSGVLENNITGANLTSERGDYEKIDGTYSDFVPFLWHEFEKIGYITSFIEDQPPWAIFNYLKDGYRYRPAAFYGRPYWLKYYKIRSGGYSMCHQNIPTYKTYYNLIESFLKRMNSIENKNTPYFSFNFFTEYTHDYLASPPQLDKYTSDLLIRLEENGYLDNTLLILHSDHGNRLQSFAYGTEIGKIEKFLPFLSVRLPRKLWKSSFQENLKKNKKKLISFFDLYQTLRQFLHLNSNFSRPLNRAQYMINDKNTRYKRGISLFENIPTNRSCADALIPEEQCRCFKQYILNEENFIKETHNSFSNVIKLILNKVNKITDKVRDRCAELKEDKIQSVKLLNIYQIIMYKFVVIFQPGNAWFEASLKQDQNNKKLLIFHGNINRISAYGNSSNCVDDSFMRNYCYCE